MTMSTASAPSPERRFTASSLFFHLDLTSVFQGRETRNSLATLIFSVVTVMATVPHFSGFSSFGLLIASGLHRLLAGVTRSRPGRLMERRMSNQPAPHRPQQHFGSLDDQLLADLGLRRSEMRAAEYGIIPGEQALHQPKETSCPERDAAIRP